MKTYRYTAIVLASFGIILANFFGQYLPEPLLLMGICIGILFVIMASVLTKRWLHRSIQLKDIASNERILLEEGSTCFQRFQSESGKLFLTNRRLCFYGKGVFRTSTTRLQFKKSQIVAVTPYSRAWLPTGFQLKTKAGEQYAFAVDDQAKWITQIQQVMRS
ncbi:MAG: PH domain-containing protein [Bacteroidota bacterium]